MGEGDDGPHVCPHYGTAENVVPVWYSKVRFLIGAEPDHIGCTECREMVDNDHGDLGIPDLHQPPEEDETPTEAGGSYEFERVRNYQIDQPGGGVPHDQ